IPLRAAVARQAALPPTRAAGRAATAQSEFQIPSWDVRSTRLARTCKAPGAAAISFVRGAPSARAASARRTRLHDDRVTVLSLPGVLRPDVAVVAAEEFIPAIARQADGHSPSRQLRDQKGGNLRGVGERLIIQSRQARDDRHRLGRRDIKFSMLGP